MSVFVVIFVPKDDLRCLVDDDELDLDLDFNFDDDDDDDDDDDATGKLPSVSESVDFVVVAIIFNTTAKHPSVAIRSVSFGS